MIFIKSREAKYPNLREILWKLPQNMGTFAKSCEIYAKYAILRKIPWELRKICERTLNPVRITQNMRTYAKSRENYTKYAKLRKIPWELH